MPDPIAAATFPRFDLQIIRAPAQVRAHDHDLAFVDTAFVNGRMLLQQHRVVAHDGVNPFGVDDRLSAARVTAPDRRPRA